ncbi:UNVERIFIED_CONTAM: hypothetical protein Sangu_1246100 [Sesamum angustifolium]|uniref:Electron transporter n=1 Tax=Sesamum angustifolium TaxID=2727405 RepID=A0AAW2NKR4_9LAMI
MGLEGFSSSKWPGLVRHMRSKSFPDTRGSEENNLVESTEAAHQQKLAMVKCLQQQEKQSSNAEIQHCLRQEILLLEKRLQDQVSVRCALEKALGYGASSHDITNEATIPKVAPELIKEIAVLELEVGHLEQYLLSLYRKAFDQQMCSLSPSKKDEVLKCPLATPRRRRLDFSRSDITSARESAPEAETQTLSNSRKEANGSSEEKLVDSGVQRSHSSLSQRSALANRTSPPEEALGKAVRACHSQPLSMMECMCNIYCKLADPPLAHAGLSSPTSSLSSISAFSPKDQCDLWSPGFRHDSSFDVRLDNPFHVEGLKDFSGPYSTMIEVSSIYRDSQKLGDIECLLQNFRSLISRLEEIDPRKMTHEEKLAFWINVHNALVMHAFLAYGIPQNNMKRMFLLLKAAYNVGGQIVSADVIQTSILGCRMSRPAQWLRLLLSSKTKFKAGDDRQAYGIGRPEPLLHFALSAGNHSDPAVLIHPFFNASLAFIFDIDFFSRIYTPKRVFQELEAAKEDYIRATFGVRKDHKILLPKTVDSFAKDSGLCHAGIMEMILQSLPDSHKKSIKKCQQVKNRKSIEWVPHNFAFRYLILKELVK